MADPMKDVVVLLPGIGGSVLQRDGADVWALSPGAALRAVLTLGKSIKRLELQGDDPDVDDLGDGITAPRLMPDLHLLPGLDWKIDGYQRIRTRLFERFDLRAGHNFFELPYDWRRDCRVAARLLARRSHDWLKAWCAESGNDDAKLVLIGHSLGGIVARFFLELLDGWKDTRALITFGTPYSGSLNAIEFLANGFRKGWGPFSIDLSQMLSSFTSVYQLLPSYRCLEGDGDTWLRLDDVDWHGTRVDHARLVEAIELQRAVRAAVDDRLATGKPGYDVRPVIGDFQRTAWAARRLDDGRVQTLPFRNTREEGGDGTVPKVSSIPHELLEGWKNATFVSQKHASLQNDDAVFDHLAGLLRSQVIGSVDVFPAPDEPIALELDDVTTEEPFVVQARPAQESAQLTARLEPVGGGPVRTTTLQVDSDGWHRASIEGLAPGDYRVRVSALGSHPVTDIASVVDLAELERAADE